MHLVLLNSNAFVNVCSLIIENYNPVMSPWIFISSISSVVVAPSQPAQWRTSTAFYSEITDQAQQHILTITGSKHTPLLNKLFVITAMVGGCGGRFFSFRSAISVDYGNYGGQSTSLRLLLLVRPSAAAASSPANCRLSIHASASVTTVVLNRSAVARCI